jgi:hypothetical protein
MKINDSFPYEKEIDAIRAKLYEESKTMTREERIRRDNEMVRKLAQQYNWKVVSAQF